MTRQEIIEKSQQSDNNLKSEDMDIIEEIMEIGIEKGAIKEKTRIAINFYKKGMAVVLIADYLECPIEEVRQIINNYKLQQSNLNQ